MLSPDIVQRAEELARIEAERFKREGLIGVDRHARAVAIGRLIMARIEILLYESGMDKDAVEMFDVPQVTFMAMLRAGYTSEEDAQ